MGRRVSRWWQGEGAIGWHVVRASGYSTAIGRHSRVCKKVSLGICLAFFGILWLIIFLDWLINLGIILNIIFC